MEFSLKISASDYWRMFRCGELAEQPAPVQAFAQAYADSQEKICRLLEMKPPEPVRVEPGSNLAEVLERARVVGVLDAWAESSGIEPALYPSQNRKGQWCCAYAAHGRPVYGSSRDAARAAAAKAIIEAGEV